MGDQDEFAALTRPLAQALIAYLPQHFRSAYCVVVEHAPGRLRYEIGSEDHPGQGASRPSPQLHEAAHGLARWFARRGEQFPGVEMRVAQADGGSWEISLDVGDAHAPLPTEEQESARWQQVYDARERQYREHIGALPEYIQKMMNLTGVWPGGGLFAIENSKLLGGACVTTSFGLSNADMPASTRSNARPQRGEDNKLTISGTLEGRTPRWVPPGLAGYGYEICVLTKKPEPWATNLVAWAVNAEILNDVEMLDRVEEIGAVTVQDLSLGNGRSADVVIAPAASPLPASFELPNGTMHLLVITVITRPEMELALKEGQHTLVERLAKAGVAQISDPARASIV